MQTIPAYPSSLLDEQWKDLEHLVPKFAGFGRPPAHSRRHIVDAIFYLRRGQSLTIDKVVEGVSH